ncbi:MAG: hypothetical protein AB1625_04610 [Acidobacteriota bacterium]
MNGTMRRKAVAALGFAASLALASPAQSDHTVRGVVQSKGTGPHAKLRWQGPGTCLRCHDSEARQVFFSDHYQWSGDAPFIVGSDGPQGKMTAINSYCGNITGNWGGCSKCHVGVGAVPEPQPSQAQLANIDCLLCHQKEYKRKKVGDQWVPDTEAMTITMDQAVRTVHQPVRANCLQCHANGGGGDNYKRGDLAMAHAATSDRAFDVHMATTGANLACQSCHDFEDHLVAGRGSDLRVTESTAPIGCSTSSCHTDKSSLRGHDNETIGRHVARVACQTCHVSTFARNAADTTATEATETYRNWLEPHPTPSGQIHPTVTLANDLKPKYFFWNGHSTGVSLFDEVSPDPVTGRYTTSRPVGAIDESASKLFPFKVKAANYPLATRVNQLVALDTKVYFATGDAQAATVSGLVNMGFSPSEPVAWVETDTYQLITHEVRREEQALQCANCHGTTTQMDLKGELGYALKAPQSTVCVQCHGQKERKSFTELHNKHVKDKRYDCSWCHSFSRPERGLRMP